MTKVVIGMLLLAGVVPASTPIVPGRWIIDNQLKEALIDGRRDNTSFPPAKPRSVCLAAADAVKGPGLAFSDGELCKVLKNTISNGTFDFETECKATDSEDRIVTRSNGHFSPENYSGTSTSVQRRDGIQIEMRSQVQAKRMGDC